MNAWTTKSHYPVVTVESVTDKADGATVKIKQEPFLLNSGDASEGADVTRWQIPIMTKSAAFTG